MDQSSSSRKKQKYTKANIDGKTNNEPMEHEKKTNREKRLTRLKFNLEGLNKNDKIKIGLK